jgi:hypothetical protein
MRDAYIGALVLVPGFYRIYLRRYRDAFSFTTFSPLPKFISIHEAPLHTGNYPVAFAGRTRFIIREPDIHRHGRA